MSRRSSASVFGGSGAALRRAQRLQALGRVAQRRLEAADAEAGQAALHPVHDAGALADQALALAVGAPGVLLREGRDRGHAAVVRLAAQPAEKGALEQLGVEPVGLGPPVLARDGDARRVDHVRLDAAGPQPARQPEAVAAGLEGHRDARDRAPGLGRLVPPAPQQPQQRLLVRLELLERLALEARDDPGHQPARLAHLDDRDQRAVLVQGDEGPAQVVRLWHGALHPLASSDDGAPHPAPPHSFCTWAWMPTPARSWPRR